MALRYVREFTGFAGIRIESDDIGHADDPSIILLHGPGQTRKTWEDVVLALEQAGRHVINVDLRGHGGSEWPADARYDFDAYVQDLRAVLGQMRTRPVVVAAADSAWIAVMALADEAATLASGLVLVDPIATAERGAAGNLPDPGSSILDGTGFDPQILERFSVIGANDRLRTAVSHIRLPALIVRGGFALAQATDALTGVIETLTDVETVEIDGGGALVLAERTEAFNGVLIDFLERKQPRFVSEYRSGSDARTLRDALGCFATGVTIVTARTAEGDPVGLTANSFTSVSLDPPLLLVCIANNAGTASALKETKHFAVNLLQIGQQPVSNRFAGKGEDRFADTKWEVGEYGAPILHGSLGVFECERHAVHEGGDHFILVGRVEKASFEPRRDPLLYFRGKYRRLHFT